MRVVLDTNVLVSALLFGGKPAQIVEFAAKGKIELCISPFILDEFEGKLKEKFKYSAEDAGEARSDVEVIAEIVHPHAKLDAVKRKDSDNRILECAVEAKAAALVTGDIRDIRSLGSFQGINILTPREFLDRYFPAI